MFHNWLLYRLREGIFCAKSILGIYIENFIKSFVCAELETPAEAMLVEASWITWFAFVLWNTCIILNVTSLMQYQVTGFVIF